MAKAADNTGERPILKSKIFLYVTEFFSGMAVMAAELGASRLLAPYFSSSQIVWTIIIGTIMIALALGAVFGGRWADKDPNPDKLYFRILVAAVWIALIPLVGKYLIILISGLLIVTVSTNFLVIAAFASCMIIFVPPLFLLGTVTPGLNKFATDSLENNASVVGRLSACNTVGSILGTFLPTFVTIPAVGTFVTFLIFSGLLLALPIVYFFAAKARRVVCAVSVAVFAASACVSPLTGFAFWENRSTIAYEGESIYNYLQVKNLSDRTILSTNVLFGVQSVTMKDKGLTGMYYDTALAAPALASHADSALILGMGTGTYARQLRQYYPDMRVTGVEIDQKITDLAGRYFDEPSDIEVSTYDGRAWLAASENTYDVIMVDAYQDITIPFQMSSAEFFDLVRSHLNPGGVMVVNMNMISDGRRSINEALTDTISSVFGSDAVRTADVPGTTNRELFARNAGGSGDKAGLSDPAALESAAYDRTHSHELASTMADVAGRMQAVDDPAERADATILTDDKAPVEVLGMRAIDNIIAEEAGPYRELLKTEGIAGLLKAVQ
ncbi:MAG: fused MFS/spermidine synthase [Bifidobacterium scardovii]|uniref:spermidine synthase n=2 Tax=Bifidobacterium scardovii TaxID=158787 RepID=UPI00069E318D|nr:fused MFS/spermidine synthase [Bifidobacterium scardovii]MDU3735674.1 fused MFS/spermidine synthase [Bifidobacterium scardovii]MDU5296584.1 fused MFS/spermidine synthase [Bifidobacterium scardovii]MDU5609966.1 fused MFS/spermidine synthase [Bifidobacterium scardovii]MDU5888045.1 fused MFS/spermidine synthase [Bifidobacterium scardovii]MDU6281090.1 fused MFS/spermidine synthase [Bifidobacterium scardovii]